MTQLVCNGERLDLGESTRISLKKTNPLFAFDKLSCERTTEFSIPDTPKNDRVFALAKVPAYDGEGMRVKYDAELQDGTIVKRGYLYVKSYAKGGYKAIFVTGELLGLLAIKNAGRIVDFLTVNEWTIWGNPINATEAYDTMPIWQSVKYQETFADAIPYPSYSLSEVVDRCFRQLGLQTPALPDPSNNYTRVIPEKLKAINEDLEVVSTPMANSQQGDPINALQFKTKYFEEDSFEFSNGLTGTCEEFEAYDLQDIPAVVRFLSVDESQQPEQQRTLKCLRAKYDCTIVFGPDAPENLRIFTADERIAPTDYSRLYQLGGPEFGWGATGPVYASYTNEPIGPGLRHRDTHNILRTGGTPIRGKSFYFSAGTKFAFFDPSDLQNDEAFQWILGTTQTAYFTLQYEGGKNYFVHGQKGYSVSMKVTSAEPVQGGNVVLQPNLPGITIVDALKVFANLSGAVLNYTDASGVIFERLQDVNTWPVISLDGVVNIADVKRTFSSYAQRNTVQFSSSDAVYDYERLRHEYTIKNDNIAEEAELYTFPFSEGGIGSTEYEVAQPVLVRDSEEQTGANTIGWTADGDIYIGRVELKKNAFIQRLCDASTCVTVTARMTQLEYERITAKTLILLQGTLYVWTDATWSSGLATYTLAKI